MRAGLLDLSPGLRRVRLFIAPRFDKKLLTATRGRRHVLRLVDARLGGLLQRDHRGEKTRFSDLPRLRLLRVPRVDDTDHGQLDMRK